MSPVAAKLHDVAGALAGRRAAPARGDRRGVRQRRDRRQRLLPGRRPRRAAGRARLGRAGRRAVRRAADLRGGRRAGPLDAVEVARPGRPGSRPRAPSCPPTTRAGCAPSSLPDLDGPGARLRAGRRGQHRRVRPVRRDRRLAGRAVAAGSTSTGPSGCGRSPTRAAPTSCAGSTGPTRGPPTATSGSTSPTTAASRSSADWRTCAARSPPWPATCPTERPVRGDAPHAAVVAAGPVRSRCGPCCARSVETAWPQLVTRACDAAAAIAERLEAGGLTVLNDVVLNQVLVRQVDGPTHGGADRRGPGRRPRLVRSDPVGRGDGDADQRVVVEDRSRRRRARGRRDPRLRGPGAQRPLTAVRPTAAPLRSLHLQACTWSSGIRSWGCTPRAPGAARFSRRGGR